MYELKNNKFALEWWNKLPNHGEKLSSFNECRFNTKGGLTQIYHQHKFFTELTEDEIVLIYKQQI